MPVSFYVESSTPPVENLEWNENYKDSDIHLYEGNLRAELWTGAGTFSSVLALPGKSSGKWFVELEAADIGNSCQIGLANSLSVDLNTYCGLGNDSWGCAATNGRVYHDGGDPAYIPGGWDASDTPIGLAVDVDAGKFWISKDGVWTGDPVAGTGEGASGLTGTLYLMISFYAIGQELTINTTPTYSAPSGYSNWA